MTLLFINSLKEPKYKMASKMATKEDRFYCGFFSYINISDILMSEICFNCNECLFLKQTF